MSSIDPCIGVSVTSLHAVVRWYCNYSSEINAHLIFIAFFVVVSGKENIDISYSYIIFGSKKYSKERKKKFLYLVVLLKNTNKNQI